MPQAAFAEEPVLDAFPTVDRKSPPRGRWLILFRSFSMFFLVGVSILEAPFEFWLAGEDYSRVALLVSKVILLLVVVLAARCVLLAEILLVLVCGFGVVAVAPSLHAVYQFSVWVFGLCMLEVAAKISIILSFLPNVIGQWRQPRGPTGG
ncbi:hypothetical protein [Paraburkholderia sp. BCC1884]|uniref:hypothetical protein n=1 Tax=Paraburkholderia sp. BCC1884 TaxID=2562668 RepID=UPI00118250F4|nr:hypothetical protein [Paraburkholderia sp. BCC1884]